MWCQFVCVVGVVLFLILLVSVSFLLGGCCEFWGGRCEVGDVTMCWEMIGL